MPTDEKEEKHANDMKVLRLIRANGTIKFDRLRRFCGGHWHIIDASLQRLRRNGLIAWDKQLGWSATDTGGDE